MALRSLACPAVALLALSSQAGAYSFDEAQALLKTYCRSCHQGKSPAGGFDLARVVVNSPLHDRPETWNKLLARMRNGEMPPKGLPAPSVDERESFTAWLRDSLRTEACVDGVSPGPAPIRRLNRDQYSATLRDLLSIHLEAGAALPVDGAGGEGFDNAAETLFLSPIHAEKYMDAAKLGLDFAARDSKAHAKYLIAKPGEGLSPDQAARRIFEGFLPRAFRRPLRPGDAEPYL